MSQSKGLYILAVLQLYLYEFRWLANGVAYCKTPTGQAQFREWYVCRPTRVLHADTVGTGYGTSFPTTATTSVSWQSVCASRMRSRSSDISPAGR